MVSYFFYLPFLGAFISCLSPVSTAQGFDHDSWQCERNKVLVPLSLMPYEEDVRIMNSWVNQNDPDELHLTPEQHHALAQQIFEEHQQQEAAKTPAQRKAEKRKEKERQEQERKKIEEIENKIITEIKKFCEGHPTDRQNLKKIFKKQEYSYWADFCEKVGDHFWDQKRYDDADHFYDLATLGVGHYAQNYAASSKGRMHLEQYNQELILAQPQKPTPSLFHNLQQAIWAFYDAAYGFDEVAEFALPALKKQRNQMVRWHLSKRYIAQSLNLREIAYAFHFVDKILKQADSLKRLFQAKRYDGSKVNVDLVKPLMDLNFWGIWQSHNHHNWVRQDGIIVRVKRLEHQKAEFTIGITAQNPLIWNHQGRPTGLALYRDGKEIAFHEDNEIFKLVYHKGAVFVVPSRKVYERWNCFQYCEEMMNLAHYPLIHGFGDARNHYSTQEIEKNCLSF